MKKTILITGITIFSISIVCLVLTFSCMIVGSHRKIQNIIQITNTGISHISRPIIIDKYNHNMKDEMGSNTESTLQIRESYREKPYIIYEDPGGNSVEVYLPTFFEQTIEKQNEFSEKLRKLQKYTLSINIFTYSQFEKNKIRRFYDSLQPQLTGVTFRFYDIPINYYELFSEFGYNLTEKDLMIEFYGKMFPDGFMIDSFIDNINDMLEHNLSKGDRLHSISFFHQEAGNIYFVLSQYKTLQQLPTKSLFTNRILIDGTPDGPGDTLHGKEKIEQFFQKSTIENLQLDSIGEKKDGKITLYGF